VQPISQSLSVLSMGKVSATYVKESCWSQEKVVHAGPRTLDHGWRAWIRRTKPRFSGASSAQSRPVAFRRSSCLGIQMTNAVALLIASFRCDLSLCTTLNSCNLFDKYCLCRVAVWQKIPSFLRRLNLQPTIPSTLPSPIMAKPAPCPFPKMQQSPTSATKST